MKTYKIIILSVLFSFILILQSPFYAYGVSISTLRSEAVQGNAAAEDNLGDAYEYGYDIPKDYVAAAYWYRLSAAQGNMYAEASLAQAYH
ncbi:MAG: hypothetical protein ACYCSQ_09135 [bacterium]